MEPALPASPDRQAVQWGPAPGSGAPGADDRRDERHEAFADRKTDARILRMPALTVPDITVLPRIPAPDPTIARERPVRSLTTAPHGLEG